MMLRSAILSSLVGLAVVLAGCEASSAPPTPARDGGGGGRTDAGASTDGGGARTDSGGSRDAGGATDAGEVADAGVINVGDGGTLMCLPPLADCDEDPATGCEVNIQTSIQHCGRCGNPCPSHEDSCCPDGHGGFSCRRQYGAPCP